MYFNYKKEKAKFLVDWAQEEKLLRSQNVSEETIAEIYRFTLEQFNSYRSYYRHKEDLSENDELGGDVDFDGGLDLLDLIENPKIVEALSTLTKAELTILQMHYKEQLSITQISIILNEKYDTVQRRIYRTKSKIKKYF